jgi:hypothetical protein
MAKEVKKKPSKGTGLNKGRTTTPNQKGALTRALTTYEEVCGMVDLYMANNRGVIDQYNTLVNARNAAQEDVKAAAKALASGVDLGREVTLASGERVDILMQVSRPREVNAKELLAYNDDLRDWDGLFTVSMGKFDAAVESGAVADKDVKTLVTYKPPQYKVSFKPRGT